jgi:ribA/ribD-fused uncharacterized protein
MDNRPIDRFTGEYRWLTNFAPSPITDDGIEYPTAEHRFQAHKTTDPEQRRRIAAQPTPGKAKAAGRRVAIREGWDHGESERAMRETIAKKFAPGTENARRLEATGHRHIEEGNNHGDREWGTVNGEGKNRLGRIIEAQRAANRRAARTAAAQQRARAARARKR